WFLYRLALRRHGESIARTATILFLTYPYAMYYSAGYSEATYLFFTVGAFYFADEERWAPASILCGISTASRGVAIINALALAMIYLEKKKWRPKSIDRRAAWLLLSATGFIGYSIYLWHAFGQPFAYV